MGGSPGRGAHLVGGSPDGGLTWEEETVMW